MGTVERTLVEVVAPVSEQITAIEVERGAHVEAGAVLVRLDSTFALAELAGVEAELAGARKALVVSGHDYDRSKRLRRDRVISQRDLDHAELTRDEAAARLRAGEARLAAARKHLADHTLTAPVCGVVDQIPFDQGERVPAGAVVTVILEDGAPWVRVWIPERAVALLGPGSRAEVRVDGIGRTFRGHILDVAREPEFTPHYALTERERVHLVYEARVVIDNAPPGLRPGVPADVAIPLGASDSPPAAARQ